MIKPIMAWPIILIMRHVPYLRRASHGKVHKIGPHDLGDGSEMEMSGRRYNLLRREIGNKISEREDLTMQWKRVTVLCQGVAVCALWVCGLQMLQSAARAQTSQDTQAEKTSKPKKSKKSAPVATSSEAAAPAAADEKTTPPKKLKKSTADVTHSGSANRDESGENKRTASAPVTNASSAEVQSAKAAGKVWVNTASGVYHKSGRWFGATKQGQFMTEQEAIKAGYRAAKNEK